MLRHAPALCCGTVWDYVPAPADPMQSVGLVFRHHVATDGGTAFSASSLMLGYSDLYLMSLPQETVQQFID